MEKSFLMLKQTLYNNCKAYVEQRISTAKQAMQNAQDAANNESKSTAGDKHDTARAMMHIEKEQNARLLAESNALADVLSRINPEKENNKAVLGSVVRTNRGNFYLSISAGKLQVENDIFFAISTDSPIGKLMLGLVVGECFEFRGVRYEIVSVA